MCVCVCVCVCVWCPSRALASNFSRWLAPLVFSISISICYCEALASRWPWSLSLPLPLQLCLHFQFPRDMCISLYDVPACSIPLGYVHEFCLFWPRRESWVNDPLGMIKGNSLGSMIFLKFWRPSGEPPNWGKRTCWEVWWFWPMRKSLKMCDPLGNIFFFFMAYWGTCVDSNHKGVSSNLRGLFSS